VWERKKKERGERKMKTRSEQFSREKLGFRETTSNFSAAAAGLLQTSFKRWCSNTAQHIREVKQRFQKKLRIREKVLRVAPQFDPGDSFNALLILQ
jgi:hypothetical protein